MLVSDLLEKHVRDHVASLIGLLRHGIGHQPHDGLATREGHRAVDALDIDLEGSVFRKRSFQHIHVTFVQGVSGAPQQIVNGELDCGFHLPLPADPAVDAAPTLWHSLQDCQPQQRQEC